MFTFITRDMDAFATHCFWSNVMFLFITFNSWDFAVFLGIFNCSSKLQILQAICWNFTEWIRTVLDCNDCKIQILPGAFCSWVVGDVQYMLYMCQIDITSDSVLLSPFPFEYARRIWTKRAMNFVVLIPPPHPTHTPDVKHMWQDRTPFGNRYQMWSTL